MKDLFGDEIPEQTKRGGGESMYKVIGASNHCSESRQEDDFYATPELATEELIRLEKFNGRILEPSCGQGHISRILEASGYSVESRDLVDRGYGKSGCDFLSSNTTIWNGSVIMNPPYSLAQEFVEKALSIIPDGFKVAAFLKLTFAEGQRRRSLFENNPPARVWISSKRLECGKNGVFTGSSAVAYAWWVWEKGFKGHTEMRWFN